MDNRGDPRNVIEMMKKGNRRGLAKAISMVEDGGPEKEILLEYAYHQEAPQTMVLGITGAGGAGKSTLIDKLVAEYRERGKTVGVIAVDPSSPYSGGAFLGDRVRMSNHNTDIGVFIRSFGSRNCLGGMSEAAKNVLYLYKAFGFDVVIVESIGVGQDETEISRFVDVTTLVLVPGLGDAMQMAKAGVREIADIFVINKSDKPEAEVLKEQLLNSFGILPLEIRPPVISTVASEGTGVAELVDAVADMAEKQQEHSEKKRRERIWAEVSSSVLYLMNIKLQKHILDITEEVYKGKTTPFEASRRLADCIQYRRETK